MRTNSRILIFFLIFAFCLSGYAQSAFIDSLKTVVASQKKDSFYVKNLVELGIQTRGIDLEVSKNYFDQVIIAARECKFERGIMLGYYHRAVVEFFIADFDMVDSFLQLTWVISKKRGDLVMESAVENIRGIVYQRTGRIEQSIRSLHRSAEIALQQDDSLNYAVALSNIAEIHFDNKNFIQAVKYFKDCEKLFERYGEPEQIASAYIGLASAVSDPPEKKQYSLKALDLGLKYNIPHINVYALNSISEVLMSNSDSLQKAERYLLRALGFTESYAEALIHCSILINLGTIYLKQEKLELSESRLLEAYGMARTNGLKDKTMHSTNLLSELYKIIGNLSLAYKYLKESKIYSDSLQSEKITQQIQYSSAQFESEKRETEILRQQSLLQKQQSEQRLFRLSAFGAIILLTSIFFGVYQRIKRKRKEAELALQLEHQRTADLEEMAKVKTDFFNNVSHELRTPLTLVIAPIQDALDRVQHVDIKNDLDLALRNSKKLLNLTNEILDLSKIDENKLVLELRNLELVGFLKRVFHSFDSLAKSRAIRLEDNLDELDPVGIKADGAKLEKILNNLISNAIKYSEDGSGVVLNVEAKSLKQNNLVVSISDRGKGIAEEDREKIFDRFYQSSGTLQSSGTGIGLALVKELCTLMNGKINLNSEVGKGSVFMIEIRFERSDNIDSVEVLPNIEDGHSLFDPILLKGQKPRILFVEDDPEMSKYLISLFEKDYDCEAAFNGKQALGKLLTTHYDLISTDIMMPEMDGFEFREKINLDEKWKNTPFIMLTARVLEEDKLKGFQLGIDDYITKPFSSLEIKARIYNLLKNKQSRDLIDLENSETIDHAGEFVRKAEATIQSHLDDEKFGVELLASELNYSSRQLGRLLQKYTGLLPVNFILEIRLQKAYQLIRDRKFITINEVRYEVGIESASYFSTTFKERFGVSPGELS